MKKIFVLLFASLFLYNCTTSKLFTKGEINLPNSVEKIPLNYTNKLPVVVVSINGKDYNFLIDTGAPTVISNKIYNELNLKPATKNKISDSQNEKETQIFTILPEMKVGNITFTNIGSVVIDFQAPEFKCLELEGILGANQMAKALWKFNYDEETAEITTDISNFDMNGFDHVFQFTYQQQKTPKVEGILFDDKFNFTFDTGYNGRFKLNKIPSEIKENGHMNKIETSGASSFGIYGKAESSTEYIFKTDEFKIADNVFKNEIISTGLSSLIGNEFLQDFIFVIDWNQSKIYLKKIKNIEPELETYGFGYRFMEKKAVVTLVYNTDGFPLQLGDIILSLNDKNLENLSDDEACEIKANSPKNEKENLKLKIKRNDEVLNLEINKTSYFSDDRTTVAL
ncbi:aspartyl protease family protein [Moheibacter sediminis]|uniref:Aspartyl protease n=1 Tax=Moheibacter sediminis TaxID=1434700 RepID=A0A1W2AGX1_9FLAO|nr:aspartyl protease family protein [Moheibacter sediminis]SMC59873.1 Aspartyl protease [Moheibacter sediminis]